MGSKKKKLVGQQGELMRALNITPDDLIANDEGYISERQRESVVERNAYQWQGFQIITVVLALFGGFFVAIASINTDILIPLIVGAIFLLMATFFGIISVKYRQTITKELQNNRFETTQGIAIVNVTEQKSQLEVNGLNLNASPDVLRRVQHLQPYLIHYLPKSKVILSMEHISEENNLREDLAHNRLQDNNANDSKDIPSENDTSQLMEEVRRK